MTLHILLEDDRGTVVERICAKGNEEYLCRENESQFPMLSRLSTSDYDVFASPDMAQINIELEQIAKQVDGEKKAHVRAIQHLAERCAVAGTWTLTITPFGE